MRASAGKSRVQDGGDADHRDAAGDDGGHGADQRATAPDSKAPSSFDALMKTHSTALTRPCSCGGVSSATAV